MTLSLTLTNTLSPTLGGGGVTLWQPTDLSGLIGWWDASDATTISETTTAGRVSDWADKSGNENHLSVNSSANEPETGDTTINGLNTIRFGENAASYLSPNGTLTGVLAAVDARDISIHIVFRQKTGTSNGALVSFKSSTGSDFITPAFAASGANTYFPENTGGSAYLLLTSTEFPKATTALIGFDGDASNMVGYKNGVAIGNTGAGASSNHFNRFVLGFRVASSQTWFGEIAEIILSTALSTADRQAVEGYLANKWGIA